MSDSLGHIWNSFIQKCSLKTCCSLQERVAAVLIGISAANRSHVCHQSCRLLPYCAITSYKYIQAPSMWHSWSTVYAGNRRVLLHSTPPHCPHIPDSCLCGDVPVISVKTHSGFRKLLRAPWADLSLFYLSASIGLICVQATEHCIIAWICFL